MNSASDNLHENTTNQSSNGIYGKMENTLDTSNKADQHKMLDSSRMNPSFNLGHV